MTVIENSQLRVLVNEEKGAELTSIVVKETGIEYVWQGDEKYWTKHAPVLFPFIGRMQEQKYTYRGKEYEIGIHGFVRNSVLEARSIENGAVFTLEADYDSYPFPCTLEITYRLDGMKIHVDNRVINRSGEEMIYTFGGHPGFNVPLNRELQFSDYYVEFPEASPDVYQKLFSAAFLDDGSTGPFTLRDGKVLPLDHHLFDNDAVVLANAGHQCIIRSEKDPHWVKVTYPGFPNVGFWHSMKSDAPFLCVEPWMSMPGTDGCIMDIEKKQDYLRLPAGEERHHFMDIELG